MSLSVSPSSSLLRVAVIGYGNAGATFHAPLIASTAGMQVAAIVTGNPERQQVARQHFPDALIYTQVQELWDHASEYDLAVIATPNQSHYPLGLAALEAGLPVIIDKPLAGTIAEAEQLLAKSQATGKMLTVFQNRRWDGDFLTIKRLIQQKTLDSITRFESRFERYRAQPRPNAWRESADPSAAGGLLYDIGSHLIDQALQLFGQPVSVYAEMDQRRPQAQIDDDSFVALRFANGVRAHLWMSLVARRPGPRFRLIGLRGTYEKWGLDPQENALKAGQRPGHTNWGQEPRELWGTLLCDQGLTFDGQIETLPGSYEDYYAHIHSTLKNGAPPPVDPADAIAVLRIIEAAQRSARNQTIVML
ncbi:Gfo/Idh/MocA family oxidoreductase [Tengunoibacter tsumagoiensis]|uniref:Oxidoreductase n=1 Tax=Tengunoibacter tsumagoiensis TaxID=2014871 RepID=A0A402A3Z5_9CHLR|nr:Gfo/Idh/MocA family oxidoreductase [Tengunoibacter tsumagoiensis]GCE13812.1 oxidoreductase [Tengunoibacter tsumagoiensis]